MRTALRNGLVAFDQDDGPGVSAHRVRHHGGLGHRQAAGVDFADDPDLQELAGRKSPDAGIVMRTGKVSVSSSTWLPI